MPYLEDMPRGVTVDPQRLVQRTVERGAVAAELSPQLQLAWASVNTGGSSGTPSTWAEWPTREDEASAPCPRPPATMWPLRRLTRAPSWDSGESVGKLAH
jgi:hypothetical protein